MKSTGELKEWYDHQQIALAEKALQKRGFNVLVHNNGLEASEKLLTMISREETVGTGSSCTLVDLGIIDELRKRGNPIIVGPDEQPSEERVKKRRNALLADVFITSVNAISTDGYLVSIDGSGNRVAATFFGPRRVFVIAGVNKIVKNLEMAMERARKVAIINCERLDRDTPCREKGKCYDCIAPDRICKVMMIIEGKPVNTEINVMLVKEELGL